MSNLNPLSWRQKPERQTPKVWDPFTSLHEEVDRLFNSFNRGAPLGSWAAPESDFQAPKLDISETENALTIEADLPGLDEADVEVILADNILTIRGEKKTQRDEQKKEYHLIERSSASFSRSLSLPFNVSSEAVDAHFAKGVLTISVPKPLDVQNKTQRIDIRSSD